MEVEVVLSVPECVCHLEKKGEEEFYQAAAGVTLPQLPFLRYPRLPGGKDNKIPLYTCILFRYYFEVHYSLYYFQVSYRKCHSTTFPGLQNQNHNREVSSANPDSITIMYTSTGLLDCKSTAQLPRPQSQPMPGGPERDSQD